MPAQVAVEGVSGLEEEAGWSVGIVGDRRDDRERLVGGAGRHPHILLHPATVGGLVLVLVAPAGIRTFEQIHQALTLFRLVAVIVDADHVAEGVESDLLGVADAVREDFEAGAVRFAPQHASFMRIGEVAAFFAHDVRAFVSHRPIDASVRAEP